MISSRSPRKTPFRPFLVIDDKGGEIIEDESFYSVFSVSDQANPEVPGFQIRKFRVWVWDATCHVINSF